MLSFGASSFLKNGAKPISQSFAWQALATNNNTSSLSSSLNLHESERLVDVTEQMRRESEAVHPKPRPGARPANLRKPGMPKAAAIVAPKTVDARGLATSH